MYFNGGFGYGLFGSFSADDQTLEVVLDILKYYILDEFALIVFGVKEILG